ncbi:hypothetical protein K413DRAFT_4720 [Clostridium sp. ASBs410]|nr:hypothetical protein K413DRAFT_4720 [Clostridium sp. ASBs410]
MNIYSYMIGDCTFCYAKPGYTFTFLPKVSYAKTGYTFEIVIMKEVIKRFEATKSQKY